MVNLVYAEALGRKIRREGWKEIGIPTTTRIKEAIEAGRTQEALELVDYLNPEGKTIHDIYLDWTYTLLTYIADNLGEEHLLPALKYSIQTLGHMPFYQARLYTGSTEEKLQLFAESNRAHRHGPGQSGEITMVEKPDRYVIEFNRCGSGGKLRMIDPMDKSPARIDPPYNLGKTKKAYPWSWGKAGVPYYCLHCCVWSEIIPTERNGYPSRLTQYSDDPTKPCGFILYKNPEDIPEHYFTRIGFKKDLSRIRRQTSPSKG